MSNSVKLNLEDWDVKSKLEVNGKMKIAFKLNKEESEAYKAWAIAVKPPDIAENDFVKSIFMHGIASINEHAKTFVTQRIAQEKLAKQKEESLTPAPVLANDQPTV